MKTFLFALMLQGILVNDGTSYFLGVETWAPSHTPGVIATSNVQQICNTKWGADQRHVTEAMKTVVKLRYGLSNNEVKGPGAWCCEIDHLIPRELGGADDVDNLWPQPWADAHRKDVWENKFHKAVCAGTMDLHDAQEQMRQWGKLPIDALPQKKGL